MREGNEECNDERGVNRGQERGSDEDEKRWLVVTSYFHRGGRE